MPEPVIYIVRSWPRLSQTFVLNEVLALERRGVDLTIFSLVHSDDDLVHPQVSDVRAPVRYLEDERRRPWSQRIARHAAQLRRSPGAYLRALALCLRSPGLSAGYAESTTMECFDMAVTVSDALARTAAEGSAPIHVHAHFAHDPALVGMLVARLTGVPFTFTAHARDLIQIPPRALAAKARAARGLVTCCALNAEYVDATVPEQDRPPVLVIHHGVDTGRFKPVPRDNRQGTPALVSVGRMVEKKGFDDLLQALRLVKESGRAFRCDIYGDGPERDRLLALVESLGLGDLVRLPGARDGDGILQALSDADLFVLTPRVAADGDRDGIPNVLVEAMSCGLPVVTTGAGGVAELVDGGVNGLLAEPGDVPTLARMIGSLVDDAEERLRLGAAARQTVLRSYDVDAAARELEGLMRPQQESVEVLP